MLYYTLYRQLNGMIAHRLFNCLIKIKIDIFHRQVSAIAHSA